MIKQLKPLECMIFTIRSHKVIIDADLASLYDVPTRALNQAVKRNKNRFPQDFVFRLTEQERLEVVTNCDHLAQLKFSLTLPFAFPEHGAIIAANQAILKRLPLLQPPPDPPKQRIGFQSKGKS